MMRKRLLQTLLVVPAVMLACSGEDETSTSSGTGGSGGVDDGILRPEPNGVQISEEEACNALQGTYQSQVQALGCGTQTVRTCPGFVRVTYDPDCVLFDQGSVQGCVDHWNSMTFCEQLDDNDCLATVYPGTEPAGCP